MPGGFGTLDELFEAFTLIQTHKIGRFQVILIGSSYWSGLFKWIKKTILEQGNINKEDLDPFQMTDSSDKAVLIIQSFYEKYGLHPNCSSINITLFEIVNPQSFACSAAN